MSSIKRDSTPAWQSIGENFLYVFKGARARSRARERAGPGWPLLLGKRRARIALIRTRRRSRRSLSGAFRGTSHAWAPPAALRPSGPRRRRRASCPRGPPHRLGRRNDQRQARQLQERAILPALQCAAGQDHPQGRFASHVMAYGHPCG